MSRFASLFTGTSDNPSDTARAASPRYRLLLVDDEPNVLKALQRIFRQENYQVLTAGDGDAALRVLAGEPVQLVIADYKMPGMDGAELLRRIKAQYPDTIRIMLTGQADTGAVMGAVNEGAVYKFILKPWDDDDLRITVALALEQYDLVQRNRALQQDNARKSKDIGMLSKLAVTNRSQLAIMLHKRGLLNDRQVQELHHLQQLRKEPMIRLLLEHEDWVSERVLRDILRKDLLIEEVALPEFQVDTALVQLIPRGFCERQWVVPLKLEGRRLLLAVADPMDMGLVDDVKFVSGFDVRTVMADVAAIKDKIDEIYGNEETSIEELETLAASIDPIEGIEVVIEDDDNRSLEELLRSTEEPPAIRLVNAIIIEAIRLGASDIHIQPRTKGVVVRYRIDGVLHDKIHIPHHLHTALVSRIKVMAEMDIAERRRPQDGRITVKTPLRIVDLRISSLPTISGEKVVLRILDRNAAIHRIEDIGLSAADLTKVLTMVSKPQGIILATGPTGSGKTTTLYSLLQHDATPTKNYVTIEDPVEFYLDMAGQVHIREKIGLDFPTVLRAILRQDPDVILLGEIRDFDTAEVAFHAALTGHLVFSTLHTNSAVATIARLLDLGLKPFVVSSALEGIIAQRLVRRICTECREQAPPERKVLEQLGPLFDPSRTAHFRGRGCTRCNHTGYQGRLALFEVFTLSEALRKGIGQGASATDLTRLAAEHGCTPLIEDARAKVDAGLTTADEVLRVLGSQLRV